LDRTAVVTGAASGTGKALAHRLAEEGCHLARVDIDGEALEQVRAELASTGRKVSLHTANVSDRPRMLALPGEVLAAHGHVHLLINNAGVSVAGRFEDVPLEDRDWIFGVNFWGLRRQAVRGFSEALRAELLGSPVSITYQRVDWMARLSPERSQAVTARLSQRMPF
jgi:short-subunit dehydrogenase